jgi:hypothetical protein
MQPLTRRQLAQTCLPELIAHVLREQAHRSNSIIKADRLRGGLTVQSQIAARDGSFRQPD